MTGRPGTIPCSSHRRTGLRVHRPAGLCSCLETGSLNRTAAPPATCGHVTFRSRWETNEQLLTFHQEAQYPPRQHQTVPFRAAVQIHREMKLLWDPCFPPPRFLSWLPQGQSPRVRPGWAGLRSFGGKSGQGKADLSSTVGGVCLRVAWAVLETHGK